MFDYFTLQWKIINRSLDEFGIKPLWGYLIGVLCFAGLAVYLFKATFYAPYIFALLAISTTTLLSDNGRVLFLKQHFPHKQFYILRAIENLMVSLPFAIVLLLHAQWLLCGVVVLVGWFLSVTSLNSLPDFILPTPFARFPFEFTTGFRKNILILVLAAFLLVMAILYQNPNLGLFAIALVLLTCLVFYWNAEPVYYVWIHHQNPSGFIRHKIMVALGCASILVLPFICIYILFFSNHTLYVLMIYLLGVLYIITALLGKYAFYPSSMNVVQGIVLALSFWFPPLLVLLIPYYYRRCIHQLNPILT
jgi:hypothetical protein